MPIHFPKVMLSWKSGFLKNTTVRCISIAICFIFATTATALGATEVQMAGDSRVYGFYFANPNLTSWNTTGTKTEERFEIWQRVRLRIDLMAAENLKFRLGLRTTEEVWGHDWLTAANPTPAIQPYLAYLQFKWPGSDTEITVGYQPFALPQSDFFFDSLVLSTNDGDQATAALHLSAPLIKDTLSLKAAYGRLLAANRTYQPTTTQQGDTFDVYHLALPIKSSGLEVAPWGLLGVYGQKSDPSGWFDVGLRSGGSYLAPQGYGLNQNAMFWAGVAGTVTALAPWALYMDFIYGDTAPGDRSRSRRRGYFWDVAMTYGGFDLAKPGIFGWVGSGEDASLTNGSERLPLIVPNWGPSSFLLYNIYLDPTGTFGLGATLKDIAVIDNLKSQLTVDLTAGRNSPAGLRKALAASGGVGQYLTMGENLAWGEWVLGVSFNHYYTIHEGLELGLETGFAAPQGLHKSVWGRREANAGQDAWMVSLGLTYTFGSSGSPGDTDSQDAAEWRFRPPQKK